MNDLANWYRHQLTKDEEAASRARQLMYGPYGTRRGYTMRFWGWVAFMRHDQAGDTHGGVSYALRAPSPEDVLLDARAKRSIFAMHESADVAGTCPACWEAVPCRTVRLLASAYKDRFGYREEWRP